MMGARGKVCHQRLVGDIAANSDEVAFRDTDTLTQTNNLHSAAGERGMCFCVFALGAPSFLAGAPRGSTTTIQAPYCEIVRSCISCRTCSGVLFCTCGVLSLPLCCRLLVLRLPAPSSPLLCLESEGKALGDRRLGTDPVTLQPCLRPFLGLLDVGSGLRG